VVVKKDVEIIKGDFTISDKNINGRFEYELTVPALTPSPSPSQDFKIMNRSPSHNHEERKGSFAIFHDNKAISFLYYTVNSYSGSATYSKAELSIEKQFHGDDLLSESIRHHFENGVYDYTEICPGSPLMGRMELPSGLVLCRSPDEGIISETEAFFEREAKNMYEKPAMRRNARALFEREQRRALPLHVIVENFQIPEPIRKELKNADDSLINLLVGRYL